MYPFNAHFIMNFSWAFSIFFTIFYCPKSHTLMLLSSDTLYMWIPSPWNATPFTQLSCPESTNRQLSIILFQILVSFFFDVETNTFRNYPFYCYAFINSFTPPFGTYLTYSTTCSCPFNSLINCPYSSDQM